MNKQPCVASSLRRVACVWWFMLQWIPMNPLAPSYQPRWLSGLRRSRVHSLMIVCHCVLRNWDRILVRAVKGLISRAGIVSICPLLWQRDVELQQTKPWLLGPVALWLARSLLKFLACIMITLWSGVEYRPSDSWHTLWCTVRVYSWFYIHYINMCFGINTTKIFGKNALNVLLKVC